MTNVRNHLMGQLFSTVGIFLLILSPIAVAQNPTAPNEIKSNPPNRIEAALDHNMGLDAMEPYAHEKEPFKGKTGAISPDIVNLSLDDAIGMALKNHLTMRLAHERIGESTGKKWQFASALLPHLMGVLAERRTWKENLEALGFEKGGLIGPFNTFDARFEFTQNIIDLSALSNFLASRTNEKIARYEEKFTHQKVMLIACMAYLETLRSYGELKAAQADLELAQRLLVQAQHQHDVGVATGVDVARSETRLAQEKLRFEKSRTDVHEAFLELQRVTGLPYTSTVRLGNSLLFVNEEFPKADSAVTTALGNRLEMQIAMDRIRSSNYQYRGAQAEILPKVQIAGDYGIIGMTPESAHPTGRGTIRATMPLFEGGKIAGEIKEAKSKKKQQEITYDDLKRQIEEDVRLSLWNIETSIEQVKAARKVVALAQRELELANHRFAEGVGDNVEVVNAQTSLAEARDTYIAALTQYHVFRVNLYYALGKAEAFYLHGTGPKKVAANQTKMTDKKQTAKKKR